LEVTDVDGATAKLIKHVSYQNTPTLSISPRAYSGSELINVDITGGFVSNNSGQYIEYSWSQSKTTPGTWTTINGNYKYKVQTTTSIPSAGAWYLHARLISSQGNVSDVAGPYTVNRPPTISVNPTSSVWTKNNVSVTVTASDPDNNLSYVDYVWSTSTTEPVSGWLRDTGSSFSTIQTDSGMWYLHVKAFDLMGASASVRGGPYRIDKIDPAVDASPQTADSSTPVTVAVTAADTGGSGLKSINYRWTSSTAKPTSGWSTQTASGSSYSFNTSVSTDGTWYLHMEVLDNAGNSYYRYRGPYIYQGLEITGVTIEGCWNHWRGQVDMSGKRLSNEPHRFLSLECVKINIYTVGEPDCITIGFSEELQEMEFEDPYKNVYYYTDFFGYSVYFPDDTTFPGAGNHVYWEYYLPLSKSTKDWDDRQLRPPYSMTVTAYKGDIVEEYTISDIEITGNIYDLTYIQPVN
jgi:hypothetical protein